VNTRPDQVLSVSTPADLLALVPYLLGFHPERSVVVVALRDHRLVVVTRTDLPEPGAGRQAVRARVKQIASQLAANGATAAIVIGYGPAEAVTAVVDAARDALPLHDVSLREALRVADGRYHSYLCTDPGCCPPEGTSFDPTASPIAAQATVAGMVALPDRQSLAAAVAPIAGPARQAMHQATNDALARLEEHCSAAVDAAAWLQAAGQDAVREAFELQHRNVSLNDDQAAWLSVLLAHIPVRDYAWTHTDGNPAHVRLWTDLTRRATPEFVAAPASLLAFAAWRSGNGALANLAVDRALQANPDYRMAKILAELLRRGVPPHALETDTAPSTADGAASTPPPPPESRAR
jgi:hypothetical protein